MTEDLDITVGFDMPDVNVDSELFSKWRDDVSRSFSLSIEQGGKAVLRYEGKEYTSTKAIPEDGWVRASWSNVDGYRAFWAEDRVQTQRFRVKPWSKRWWKPWDSIETYMNDETIWHDLGEENGQ